MSTRRGEFVTIDSLLDEITPQSVPSKDVMRSVLLSRSPDSSMTFDLDVAIKESADNPVFYVQYGYARISSILRKAPEVGFGPEVYADGDLALLVHPLELALLRHMVMLPEVVANAAEQLAPHQINFYAAELARLFHGFYHDCKVLSGDPADRELSKARLRLCDAARITVARVLGLMGMTAPERM
jgi:arginyl-tRNA synthetase